MNVFTLVVFLYNVGVAYFQQCTVRTLRVDADKTGARYINGNTYITFSNIGPNACFNECIRRTKCRSFSYNSITRRCDINKMSSNSETDFVDETNCVYVDMTQYRGDSFYDPCPGSDSCVEGEVCQTLKEDTKICVKDMKDTDFRRIDLVVGKTCGQSSTNGFTCNYAIDGNLDTFSHTAHTDFSDGVNYGTSKPYWWVDLGNTYKVRRVDVYNRLEAGHRLHNLDVTAGKSLSVMSLCDHYKGRAQNGEQVILVCMQPIEARYVKLQIMEENTADNFLQLAEVKVYE
ncbi:uncharacterized protein LOC127716310 [Mytilus californianus]|uniref:uncharacterized protein LOC127716310 n=1 Tax=Mytilus californianus TaxID=6549 RepID=UPI0022450A77|nr:uncharacterized protein LOC127716310 [Mytilus californianus]